MIGSKKTTIRLRNILPLAGLVLLLIGGGVGLLLVRQNQEIRQQAAETPPPPLANTCANTAMIVNQSTAGGQCSENSDCSSPLVCSGATDETLGTCQNPPPVSYNCDLVKTIPVEECKALIALYNSTNGKNWKDQIGWMSNNDPCTWHGVDVDGNSIGVRNCDAGHVQDIRLANNNLNGDIPQEMKSLANLTYLNLGNNQLESISPELGNLPNLQVLMLGGNNLKSIPKELGNLPNLTSLWLSNNHLESISPELFKPNNLPQLQNLLLENNQLKSIPPELGNLPNLIDLRLYNNQLVGEIPSSFSGLKKIKRFYFKGGNQLCLPATLKDWFNNIPVGRKDTLGDSDYCQPPLDSYSVSGVIWNDLNKDGKKDPGEPDWSIENINDTITLKNSAGQQIGSTINNSAAFSFEKLSKGEYTLELAINNHGWIFWQNGKKTLTRNFTVSDVNLVGEFGVHQGCVDDTDCESQQKCNITNNQCEANTSPPPAEQGQVVGYVFYDADRDGEWDCEVKSKTGAECAWPGVNDSYRWQIGVKSAVDNSKIVNTSAASGGWYETDATQKLEAGDYHVTLSPNNPSEPYSYTTSRFVTTHVGKKPGKDFVNGRADFGVIPTRLVPTPPIDQCTGKDRADFDCDGDVDVDDYKTLIQNFDF